MVTNHFLSWNDYLFRHLSYEWREIRLLFEWCKVHSELNLPGTKE